MQREKITSLLKAMASKTTLAASSYVIALLLLSLYLASRMHTQYIKTSTALFARVFGWCVVVLCVCGGGGAGGGDF